MAFTFFRKFSEMFSGRFKTSASRLRSSDDQADHRDAGIPGATMKIIPRAAPLAEQTVRQEDTTAEFQAGTERRVHRRTTVTVDRETLLVLTHRSVVEDATETHDQLLLAAAPETPDEVSGGKS
jgi:hypothetical protein